MSPTEINCLVLMGYNSAVISFMSLHLQKLAVGLFNIYSVSLVELLKFLVMSKAHLELSQTSMMEVLAKIVKVKSKHI